MLFCIAHFIPDTFPCSKVRFSEINILIQVSFVNIHMVSLSLSFN